MACIMVVYRHHVFIFSGKVWQYHISTVLLHHENLTSCFNNAQMNIEDYREYCLSLGADVEEKLPFTAFRYASGVLAFYVNGHIFSFFDCDDYGLVTLKCQPARIDELKAQHSCIGKPFNLSPRYWIGIDTKSAPDELLRELTRDSYEIVKAKYSKQR